SLEYRIFGQTTNRDYEIFRDRSGSTGAIVDDDGTEHLFKYVTFGKASIIDGSGDYNFDLSAATTSSFWQGLDLDPDLGWYYARNRWYDPNSGSFISTDPLGYPDSANPYVWGIAGPWASDAMGLCFGLDNVPCADYAKEFGDQFLFENLGATGKRSARF